MIAGLLVSLTLVLLLVPHARAATAIRAVAWCTVAVGFGGAMTYGQTVGLTHDPELVGHWDALRWGMLGLAIKGGIWIGFAGLFLGMGLGGVRYRATELAGLFAALLGLYWIGVWWLNSPFDPAQKVLPRIYFSDSWLWEPGASLKPRREVWGGLLLALLGAIAYARFARHDGVAGRLAAWAILGGALGFPAGQSLQAFHAWNRDVFQSGWLAAVDSHINWWNFMETTFGVVWGGILGWGAWRNRTRLAPADAVTPEPSGFPPMIEWGLLGLHTVLMVISEFTSIPFLEAYTDFPLILGILPILAAAHGRWAPWILALPVTLLPIAVKTVRALVIEQPTVPAPVGWGLYLAVPLGLALALAIRNARSDLAGSLAGPLMRVSLAGASLVYFALNFGFFRFPWPWAAWTARTPNALVFAACATLLLIACRAPSRQGNGTIA